MLISLINKFLSLILVFYSNTLLFFGVLFLSPKLCSKSWGISIFILNYLNPYFSNLQKSNNKKKILVLYRAYGVDDLENLINDPKSDYHFLFFPRNNIRKIYNKFFSKFKKHISDNYYYNDDPKIKNAKKKNKI